jgi:hypothetical protein
MTSLVNVEICEMFNKSKKGNISKAKYLSKEDYLRRYPE